MVGKSVEERSGHLGVAKDGRPFTEVEVGGHDDRGALVKTADEVEQQLAAGLVEREVAKLVEDQEVEAASRRHSRSALPKFSATAQFQDRGSPALRHHTQPKMRRPYRLVLLRRLAARRE